MRNVFFFILFFSVNISISQEIDTILKYNIKSIEKVFDDSICFYRIIEKNAIKNDEIDLTNEINLLAKEVPSLIKVFKYKNYKGDYKFLYDLDISDDKIVVNKFNFFDLSKTIYIPQKKNDLDKIFTASDKFLFKKNNFRVYRREFKGISIFKIEMTIGLFNKLTKGMKIEGEFDKKVIVFYLDY